MVIPLFARRNGITVRLYAFIFAAIACLVTALFPTNQVSAALLPISDIPIIGQPVANVVNTVTDDVVEPVVGTVAGALPEPVGDAVQAPVKAVVQATDPIVGPAEPTNMPQRLTRSIVPKQEPQPQVQPIDELRVAKLANADLPPVKEVASPSSSQTQTAQSYTTLPLFAAMATSALGYVPVLGDMIKNFTMSQDTSMFTAASAILLVLTVLFLGLILMSLKNSPRTISSGEQTFVQKDLAQASALILCFLTVGSALLVLVLSRG